jgi:hypothetical protein
MPSAEVASYMIEGHVLVGAIRSLLGERPSGAGLAILGMPTGSPGMERGAPETYELALSGAQGSRAFARYPGNGEL